MQRIRSALACGLLALTWCAAASADVVRLKNGNVLRGDIVSETSAELKVLVNGGVVTVPRDAVAAITRERRAAKPQSLDRDQDVSESAVRKLVLEGKAREAAERLERASRRSSAELQRLAARAGAAWVLAGNADFRAKRFGAAAHAYLQALSFQPTWDRDLERRFYDAALADIRGRLLEQDKLAEAHQRVRVLRDGLPDDPVAAWLHGRIEEQRGDAGAARAAYGDAVGGAQAGESLDALRARATEAAATGEPAGGTVDWQAAPLKTAQRLESDEFVIEHRNPGAARRLARALRWHLDTQRGRLGRHASRFAPTAPVLIRLHASAGDLEDKAEAWAAGHAHSRFRGGTLVREEIDLLQSSAQLLGSALPHELGHLMLARAIGPHRRFPYALAEGFACQFEAPWKRRWYQRVVQAAKGGERLGTETLLRAQAYPPADRIARFYGGSLCLVEALLERGGMDRLVRYCERAGRDNAIDALMDMYELSPADLDALIARRLDE